MISDREPFDFVIVGGGTAGCILADRLTESGRHSVLLLEAGGEDTLYWMRVPLGCGQMLARTDVMWQFETQPDPNLKHRSLKWPRGKVLGGSSSVNATIFARGDPANYDQWRDLGNPGWGYSDVLPAFMRLERFDGGSPEYRGHTGPVSVERLRTRFGVTEAFLSACQSAGLPLNPDYNGPDIAGCSLLQFNTRLGRRQSTARAYLRRARRRTNLRVLTDAAVRSLDIGGNRATAVRFVHSGAELTAIATREIILCAGAIGSPHLLELSGVGDPARLADAGVTPRHALPGVGENLCDHLQTRLSFRARDTFGLNQLLRSRSAQALTALRYVLTGKGLMGTPAASAQAIVCTKAGPADVKIQLHHFSGQDRTSYSKDRGIDEHPGITLGIVQLAPHSRGALHITSPSPLDPPRIDANQLSHPEDKRALVAGLRVAREIAHQEPLRRFIVEELRPGPARTTDEALLDYLRESGQTSYHPIGTCKMGNDTMAVVDHRLRVHGVAGLRVVDASVMPTMPASNTNAATMMIAERAADFVLEDAAR